MNHDLAMWGKGPIARKRWRDCVTWQYPEHWARSIIHGNDLATKADRKAWNRLGRSSREGGAAKKAPAAAA
jgi:hypothetical protein